MVTQAGWMYQSGTYGTQVYSSLCLPLSGEDQKS